MGIPVQAQNDTDAWREYLLAMSTGRSAYRAQFDFSLSELASDTPSSLFYVADEIDPRDPREWRIPRHIAGKIRTAASAPLLQAIAKADTTSRKVVLILALSNTKDSSITSEVGAFLTDPNRRIRAAAAITLGDCGSRDAAVLLGQTLEDTSLSVRRIACDGLGRLLKRTSLADTATITILSNYLNEALKNEDAWTRWNAKQSLKYMEP